MLTETMPGQGHKAYNLPWSRAEEEMLRAHLSAGLNKISFAAASGRTPVAVRHRARRLGLGDYTHFTKEEDWEIADRLSRRWSYAKIGEYLGRGTNAIKQRSYHLKIGPRAGALTGVKVADLLGIDERVIYHFVEVGLLKAKRNIGCTGRKIHLIEEGYLEEWLLSSKNWRLFNVDKIRDAGLREVVLEAQREARKGRTS
jgi:hypothetical protein